MSEKFFAPCPRGLEALLTEELEALGGVQIKATEGGVHFSGPNTLAYRVNLESRIASRVLWQIAATNYRTEEDIYKAALALKWESWFDASNTIRVNVVATRSELKSLNFVTLRIKDAICDRFRERSGVRPNVSTEHPDVRIHAFLSADQLTLYLDTSGEPLFKRGWRTTTTEAPLRENLAAGIVKLTGWKAGEPLLDPMCGSGTLLIEAALIALDIAPGLKRSFGFEKLKNFDTNAWQQLCAAATAKCKPVTPLAIYGSDLYGDTLKVARINIESAGMGGAIMLKQANVLETGAPAPAGILVANLPYGVRMGESQDLLDFYPKLGNALKQHYAGWRAYLFTMDRELIKRIRLTVSKRIPLFNGALDCRLYEFKLVAGSNRPTKNTSAK